MPRLIITIGKTVDEKLYFRVRDDVGLLLVTSREYSTLEKCLNELYNIQVYSSFDFQEEKVTNGHRYALTGASGGIVGTSELYEYSADMKPHMKTLKDDLRKAEVIDQSSTVRFFRKVKI